MGVVSGQRQLLYSMEGTSTDGIHFFNTVGGILIRKRYLRLMIRYCAFQERSGVASPRTKNFPIINSLLNSNGGLKHLPPGQIMRGTMEFCSIQLAKTEPPPAPGCIQLNAR